jgi:hypothetical protein
MAAAAGLAVAWAQPRDRCMRGRSPPRSGSSANAQRPPSGWLQRSASPGAARGFVPGRGHKQRQHSFDTITDSFSVSE